MPLLRLDFLSRLLEAIINRARRALLPYLLRRAETRYPIMSHNMRRVTSGTVLKARKPYKLRPEIDAMHFLRRQGLPIPIPRLVDYWETNEEAYLIMEYIEGQSLLPLWRHLSGEQHAHIIQTLSGYVYALRAIPQAAIPSLAPAGWIGSATGGAFTDLAITWSEAPLGPFPTQAAFNDWRMSLYARYGESSTTIAARLADARRAMRDDHPIVFTHGDINMGNVLVRVHGQGPQDVEIVALLDWEQAGWRPLYWEAMKWIWLSRRHPTMSPWKDFAWKELSAGYDQDVRREFQLWEISSTPPDIED